MKRILATIIFISAISFLWAIDPNWTEKESAERVITAYKQAITANSVPALSVGLRLLNSNQDEFSSGSLEIPVANRNGFYGAFSWVFSGNAFEDIILKFSFGHLSLKGETPATSTVNNETTANYIPYEVCAVYGNSRIGNSVIKTNAAYTADSYVTNDFAGEDYRFYYADSVEGASSTVPSSGTQITTGNANAASPQITLTYNISTRTGVKDSEGNDVKSTYISKVTSYTDQDNVEHTINDGIPVCDHWNRTGTIYVKLDISSDAIWTAATESEGTTLESGRYVADVIVEVSL